MTREEAIVILNDIQDNLEENSFIKRCAIDMAIRALKEETICPILSDDEVKQPCIKSPCGFERPHGEWVDKGEYAECSICGSCSGTQFDGVEPIPLKTKFCPNCGADMRVKDELNRVSKELNSEIEKSKSEIVPDYRDGWRLKEGDPGVDIPAEGKRS